MIRAGSTANTPRPHFLLVPRGVSEYVEDLVSPVDAPPLDFVDITFFHRLIFDTPRFHHVIALTETFRGYNLAAVLCCSMSTMLLASNSNPSPFPLGVSCLLLNISKPVMLCLQCKATWKTSNSVNCYSHLLP